MRGGGLGRKSAAGGGQATGQGVKVRPFGAFVSNHCPKDVPLVSAISRSSGVVMAASFVVALVAASPALALRSIPLARSSPTSRRCSPISLGPPDQPPAAPPRTDEAAPPRSGRRLGGRQPEEQPPAAPPRTDEDKLPAILPPEPTPVSVIAIAGGGLLACVLAAMMLLGGGSSGTYYYSSSFESVTVTSRGEDGQPRVETRQQRSVKTNFPQRSLGDTGINSITGY